MVKPLLDAVREDINRLDLTSLSMLSLKSQAYVSALYSMEGVQEWIKAASLKGYASHFTHLSKYVLIFFKK